MVTAMRPSLVFLCCLFAFVFASSAQTRSPKRPIGVPADAMFFRTKWYKVYLEKTSWPDARQKCLSRGGRLAIVNDSPTWDFLRPIAEGLSLWLGATDEKIEGKWEWIDGTPFVYHAWFSGEPNNGHSREHYLTTFRDGWNDNVRNASDVVGYICEWPHR